MTMKWTSIYKVEMVLVQDFDWSVSGLQSQVVEQEDQGRVEGEWR